VRRISLLTTVCVVALSCASAGGGIGAFSALVQNHASAFMDWVGARTLAMGGVTLAVEDPSAHATWNPPRSSSFYRRVPSIDLFTRELGISTSYVTASASISSLEFGLGWARLAIDGQAIPDGEPAEPFEWVEQVLTGTVAARLEDRARAGVNANYYLADSGLGDAGSGLGFDLGLAAKLGGAYMFSLSARDVGGTQLNWSLGDMDTVQGVYRAGLAATLDWENDVGDLPVQPLASAGDRITLHGGTVLGRNAHILGGLIVRLGEQEEVPDPATPLVDVGLLASLGHMLTVGFDARGLAPFFGNPEADAGSPILSAGLALRVPRLDAFDVYVGDDRAFVAGDVEWATSGLQATRFGAEYRIYDIWRGGGMAAIRGGISSDWRDREHTLTLGGGVLVEPGRIDVVYVVRGGAPNLLVVGAEAAFRRPKPEVLKQEQSSRSDGP
jgi:hypothetical protein